MHSVSEIAMYRVRSAPISGAEGDLNAQMRAGDSYLLTAMCSQQPETTNQPAPCSHTCHFFPSLGIMMFTKLDSSREFKSTE